MGKGRRRRSAGAGNKSRQSTARTRSKVDDNDTTDSPLECSLPDQTEPAVPWADSEARHILLKDLAEGVVPMEPDESMPTNVIFTSHPEFATYGYRLFSSRLSGLRKIVKRDMSRAETDKQRFINFKANNETHSMTAHGYPEWDGSDARKKLIEDIDSGLVDTLEPAELWNLREEYEPFPLKVFRDHIYQEIGTRKFYHTLNKVKGKSNMRGGKKKNKAMESIQEAA